VVLQELPPPDIDIWKWTDGSAQAGTGKGGAGALLIYHNRMSTTQLACPAGAMCSR